MATVKMEIGDLLIRNFIPYAKMTIQDRAIPDGRDGLKPVQRRILYSAWELAKSKGGRDIPFKCARIVGDTMGKYHPHGDSSIYGALCVMSDEYNAMNMPYITGEGCFGKVWSERITPSAMRYTEAHLAPITDEMFENIKDNTIEFIPNFDDSEKEPMLLPVKFPTILVNSTSGVAVGMASYIPSYTLKSVCNATIAMASGKIHKPEDLVDILGLPDFTTGGYVHGSRELALKIIKTGKGTITMSGSVKLYKDAIIIGEIPYNTTLDRIIREVHTAVEDDKLKEIKDILDSSGTEKDEDEAKCEVTVLLKAGADPKKALAKLYRYTSLRSTISFNTNVLMGEGNEEGSPKEKSVYELLEDWIPWRSFIIKREYSEKARKEQLKTHLLESWELIKDDLANMVNTISKMTRANATSWLMSTYSLDKEQADYLMDKKIYQITTDQFTKALSDLEESRNKYKAMMELVDDEKARMKLIIKQNQEIIEKYGEGRVTRLAHEVNKDEEQEKITDVIPDVPVNILVTKKGYVKRVLNPLDTIKVGEYTEEDDPVKYQYTCNNKDSLLVFTCSGICYKVPVCNIDSSTRTGFKDYIWKMVEAKDDSDILYVCPANGYEGGFSVIYDNGRGIYLPLHLVSGNRSSYMSLYEPGTKYNMLATTYKQFFIITKRQSAAFADINATTMFNRKSKYKIARVATGDRVIGIQSWDKVPDKDFIDTSRYSRGYTVKMHDDVLF